MPRDTSEGSGIYGNKMKVSESGATSSSEHPGRDNRARRRANSEDNTLSIGLNSSNRTASTMATASSSRSYRSTRTSRSESAAYESASAGIIKNRSSRYRSQMSGGGGGRGIGSRNNSQDSSNDNNGKSHSPKSDDASLSSYLQQQRERRQQALDATNPKRGTTPSVASKSSAANSGSAKSAARQAKAHKLSPYLFDMLDADSSGCLSRDEVVSGVARMITDQHVNVTSQYLQLIGSIMTRSDVDNSGALDRKEFGFFLYHLSKSLNMPLDHLAENLMEANHCLDHEDVANPHHHASSRSIDIENEGEDMWGKELPALFAKYDESGDGVISRHELSVAMRKVVSEYASWDDDSPHDALTYCQVMDLFDENDANGDGELCQEEFSTFVSSFSLACGIPLKDAVGYLMDEANSAHEMDLALEGWKMMPYLFSVFDTDNDGSIDRNELVENMGLLVNELGLDMTLADVWAIFGEVDKNDSHDLDRHEFGYFLSEFAKRGNVTVEEVTFYLSKLHKEGRSKQIISKSLSGWDNMEQLFRRWDSDDDGHIDRRELGIGMSFFRHKCALSPIEYLKIMDEVDDNRDGVLDRREFSVFLSRFALRAGIELEELTKHLMECSPSAEQGRRGNRISMNMIWGWAKAQLAEEALETMYEVEATESVRGSGAGRRGMMQKCRSSCLL